LVSSAALERRQALPSSTVIAQATATTQRSPRKQIQPMQHALQGHSSIVIGLPDCGTICKSKHLPGYVQRIDELKAAGFPNVMVASITTPDKLKRFLEDVGADKVGVKALADTTGAFTRMLGLEIMEPGSAQPGSGKPGSAKQRSHRYTAFVQDGILVRLVRVLQVWRLGCCSDMGQASRTDPIMGLYSLEGSCNNQCILDLPPNQVAVHTWA
jgi:glutaredoxin/glutathione-dependent peroxiredoxin